MEDLGLGLGLDLGLELRPDPGAEDLTRLRGSSEQTRTKGFKRERGRVLLVFL